MSHSPPHEPRRAQVSLKTLFTIAAVAIGAFAMVGFVERTLVALALTVSALMIAVALNHGVALLVRRGLGRAWALSVVLSAALALVVGLAFTVIPPAVGQGKALVVKLPDILRMARETRVFHFLDDHLHVAKRLLTFEKQLPQMVEQSAAPVLSLVGGLLSAVVAVVSVAVVAVFMLIFGGGLVAALLKETLPERRPRYKKVIDETYASIGGYLLGLTLICFANATLTTTFLAIVRIPFFVPLGIVSGLSSMIPYAGPAVVGTVVTLIALATGGAGTGIAAAIYFVLYGQLEGQVIAPLVFKRTVHVNPLVVVLSVLFFGELAGIIGAVLAVPVAAAVQIIAREILRARRERFQLAPTPLNSPDGAPASAKPHAKASD